MPRDIGQGFLQNAVDVDGHGAWHRPRGALLLVADGDRARSWRIRASFYFTSIHHAPLRPQDRSRICVLNLDELVKGDESLVGRPFFSVFESTEILGPDFGPLHTALASGETARTLMRIGELAYYELAATPIVEEDEEFPSHLLVTVPLYMKFDPAVIP